jgi:hypothetical protein
MSLPDTHRVAHEFPRLVPLAVRASTITCNRALVRKARKTGSRSSSSLGLSAKSGGNRKLSFKPVRRRFKAGFLHERMDLAPGGGQDRSRSVLVLGATWGAPGGATDPAPILAPGRVTGLVVTRTSKRERACVPRACEVTCAEGLSVGAGVGAAIGPAIPPGPEAPATTLGGACRAGHAPR